MAITFSYSGNPATSNRDAVRFRSGDTDGEDPLLGDEEIDYLLVQEGSVDAAVIAAMDEMIIRLGRRPAQVKTGRVTIDNQARAEALTSRRDALRARSSGTVILPYAGGISKADKQRRERDPDRVPPAFTRCDE